MPLFLKPFPADTFLCLIELAGKTGHRWWLWVFLGEDTVVFRLDPSRSHEVPEGHFAGAAGVVLMVDRYSAYKAMAQVKLGNVVLVFCWSHVRRDFVKVGKAWPEHKEWAIAWLRRIRDLYRFQRQRLTHPAGSTEFIAADTAVRQTVAVHEGPSRARVGRSQTCYNLSQDAGKPPGALGRPDPVRGRLAHPDGQQRLGAAEPRPRLGP